MTNRYEVYEAGCERLRTANEELLAGFERWLADKALSHETIRRHLSYIDLYVNHYLLYEDAISAADGAFHVGMFLGYWFPRKVRSSEWSIRSSAASLNRFYKFMNERGLVSDEATRHLRKQIQEEMPGWLAPPGRHR